MIRIGDTVTHVDYPGVVGKVVAKENRGAGRLGFILVLWTEGPANPGRRVLPGIPAHLDRAVQTCSRHIPSALRRVQNAR